MVPVFTNVRVRSKAKNYHSLVKSSKVLWLVKSLKNL